MAPSAAAHGKSRSLLLLQRLLNLRDGASPMTLILDSLEQKAAPVVQEFMTRAKISGTKIIYVSFTTLRKPRDATVFVNARGKALPALRSEILSHYPPHGRVTPKGKTSLGALVVVDSLNTAASANPTTFLNFLTTLVTPTVSLLVTYHTDIPLTLPPAQNEYAPTPLTLLTHLATAILRLTSIEQDLDRQRARDRSLPEPEFGLSEAKEGVLVGMRRGPRVTGPVVLNVEIRRRSGRAETESFVLTPDPHHLRPGTLMTRSSYPGFTPRITEGAGEGKIGDDDEEPASSFDLGLTEKQRRDRDGVIPPYFDAQTEIGFGLGGRILYEMGREDDFDDEEDEI